MKAFITLAFIVGLGGSGAVQAQSAQPHANPSAPQNAALKSPHDAMAGGAAAGRNSFTMGQAREHIEKAGYTRVTGLTKDKKGLWQGKAMQDGKRVRVAMDFKGDVTSK